jgi:peptide/nickel transport system permease protein
MRKVSESDYVRAAHARGLASGTMLRSYILRNSLVPLLAAFGNQLPLLLTSTFIVEIVFSVPGIGALLLKSVLERDLPMLEGIVLATSFFTIGIGLLLELLYPLADPRIRKGHAA